MPNELIYNQKYRLSENKYLFNGKELQDQQIDGVNLDWYDYGARFYDPQIGRWHVVDPAIEDSHFENSPYTYVYNNPVKLVDPFGMDSIFYNQKGKELENQRIKCKNDYFFIENSEGNKNLKGKSYYQGLSKASFFGHKTGDGTVFENVEKTKVNDKNDIINIVDKQAQNENILGFILESPQGRDYDYKNSVLGPKAGIDNLKTAYLYNGILLNRNEIGNVLWGATASKVNMPLGIALLGAHGAAILFERKTHDELNEQVAIVLGYSTYQHNKK